MYSTVQNMLHTIPDGQAVQAVQKGKDIHTERNTECAKQLYRI